MRCVLTGEGEDGELNQQRAVHAAGSAAVRQQDILRTASTH